MNHKETGRGAEIIPALVFLGGPRERIIRGFVSKKSVEMVSKRIPRKGHPKKVPPGLKLEEKINPRDRIIRDIFIPYQY